MKEDAFHYSFIYMDIYSVKYFAFLTFCVDQEVNTCNIILTCKSCNIAVVKFKLQYSNKRISI